ncbi:MAG: hypothetical protein M3P27_07865 [Acidobacteriota bacterium]|nr:hypothetical protein [Acidobacteriota bacterium]
MNTSQRPLGVTLLSLLFFLNTAVGAVIAAFAFRDPASPARIMEAISAGSPGPALSRSVGNGMPWIAALGAAMTLALAIGLWRLRPWGRMATLAVIAASLIAVVLLLVTLQGQLSPVWMGIVALRFVVLAFFGWYLLRPQVAAAFR